jgi:multiple sugar transport system ATP-binding protein
MQLYRWPANLFVAQFIGSPPMNLLPVEVIGPGQLQLAGRRMPLEGPLADTVAGRIGHRLTGGLRPESLRLAPAANRNLRATVSHSEALGNEQLVTCQLEEGDHLVQLRVAPEEQLAPGSTIHLEVDPGGWRLFDAGGEALPLPRQPVQEPLLPQI